MNITLITLIISNTFVSAVPILLAGLGGMISERSGIINIGLEGMMALGALIAATVGYYSGNPWLALLAGGLAGMALSVLHGFVSITIGGDQTISGIAINFLGPGLALFLSRIFFDGAAQTLAIPTENKIPILFKFNTEGSTFLRALSHIVTQYATVYIAFIMVFVIWFFLYRTKWGLRLTATGDHPEAAETLNINVWLIRWLAVLFSGFMAGVGGATVTLTIVSSFHPALISGQGFIALVTVIFGKWRPQGVLFGALFFGFAQALSVFVGGTSLAIPSEIVSMIPYIATLLILIFFGGDTVAPRAAGVPYIKEDI